MSMYRCFMLVPGWADWRTNARLPPVELPPSLSDVLYGGRSHSEQGPEHANIARTAKSDDVHQGHDDECQHNRRQRVPHDKLQPKLRHVVRAAHPDRASQHLHGRKREEKICPSHLLPRQLPTSHVDLRRVRSPRLQHARHLHMQQGKVKDRSGKHGMLISWSSVRPPGFPAV